MIYELRTYQLATGALPKYLETVKDLLPLFEQHNMGPKGFWYTDIGTLNEVTSLWSYEDLADRQSKMASWMRDPNPRRAELRAQVTPLVVHENTKIMVPAEFSKLK